MKYQTGLPQKASPRMNKLQKFRMKELATKI
jgi:hypothetical protein